MSALVIPLPETREAVVDHRYRRLLGEAAWQRLPASVRRRFSKRLAPGEQVVYRGEVVCMELSRWGWLIAQAARIAGAPLPYTRDALGPSVVVVTEAEALGGQIWSRSYPRHVAGERGKLRWRPRPSNQQQFPQVIHSAKRFAGPTGLEEYLGRFWGLGLVMHLKLNEEAGQLVFRSAGYALGIAGRKLDLPRWLAPGRCTVTHRAETDGRFSFSLTLDHPWLGRLVRQVAFFEEV